MSNLDTCLGILRRLIAKGDMKDIPFAENAVSEYWDLTPIGARKSGLLFLQHDVLELRNAVTGAQHNFANAVNSYIEQKLREE